MDTAQFAKAAGVQPASVRVRLCKTGSYFGVRPARLPNGRLHWPDDSAARLLEAGRSVETRSPAASIATREAGADDV
jgi:hypothetical protein